MHIDVIPTVDEIKNDDLFQKTVIFVDVLRTSSTIITALANGIHRIFPAETVGQAKQIKKQRPDSLLVGERFYRKIPGFDYDNSPSELSKEKIVPMDMILTSTNGVRGILKAVKANNVLIGGFLNGATCAQQALNLKNDLVFLAPGGGSRFSLEDGMAIGFQINLIKESSNSEITLNDFGLAMLGIFKYYETDFLSLIKKADAGKKLLQYGLEEDIDFSCQINRYQICPIVNDDLSITSNK